MDKNPDSGTFAVKSEDVNEKMKWKSQTMDVMIITINIFLKIM